MGWTNAALQKVIDTYGERICYIGLNNGKRIFIGYNMKEGVRLKDISLETIGGIDVMKIHHRSTKQSDYYEWDNFMTTEFIESIEIMGEEYEDLRIDPLLLNC